MLTLRSKTPVRFEYTDGTAETAVTVSSEDDEATLVRKLQRVVELAGGLPMRQPGAALAAAQVEFPPLWDAEAAEAALASPKTGWEGLAEDIEDLPEA